MASTTITFREICPNPKHTGSYTHPGTNTTYTAPKFDINKDYEMWYIEKYNMNPPLPYLAFKNVWSEASKAVYIGDDKWLCETCLKYTCIRCHKQIGDATHINTYYNGIPHFEVPGSSLIASIRESVIPSKSNGYTCKAYGFSARVSSITMCNGQSYRPGMARACARHIGLHQIFLNIPTFDQSIKHKLLVNICDNCYDADPREIYIMQQQLQYYESIPPSLALPAPSTLLKQHEHLIQIQQSIITSLSLLLKEHETMIKQLDKDPPEAKTSEPIAPPSISDFDKKLKLIINKNPNFIKNIDKQYTKYCIEINEELGKMKAAYESLISLTSIMDDSTIQETIQSLLIKIDKYEKLLNL